MNFDKSQTLKYAVVTGIVLLVGHFIYSSINNKKKGKAKFDVVFVLGGPGAGKVALKNFDYASSTNIYNLLTQGTQCQLIVENFGFVHLSAGDLLREERNSGSELADMINTYIKEGKIVPAEVTVRLLKSAMEKSGSTKFLVDGFPRDLDNLKCWQQNMEDIVNVKFLLFLDCPQDVMLNRLLERGKTSGRNDDNKESIIKRFKVYEESTRPIIDYFRSINKVKSVDSNRSLESVFSDVTLFFKSI
jgi:UMP-CMP kinase